MSDSRSFIQNARRQHWLAWILFCGMGVLCNLLLNLPVEKLDLPLYLDTVGTIIVSAIGGYIPGLIVGFTSNLIRSLLDPLSVYYGCLSMLIAVVTAFAARKKWFKKVGTTILAILLLAVIGGGLGSLLTWLLYDMNIGEQAGESLAWQIYHAGLSSPFLAQLSADMIIDLVDKTVSVLLMLLVIRVLPDSVLKRFRFRVRDQAKLTQDMAEAMKHLKPRKRSLRTKITVLVVLAMLIIALVTTGISFYNFRDSLISAQKEMGRGVANVVASLFDPDLVEDYLTQGEAVPGYLEAEMGMKELRDSSDDIQYVYVYQIQEDGCHVVFDLDTDELQGAAPGEIVPFDPSFEKVLPALLAGEEIEPLITNDSYGWLLSIYLPVRNSAGQTVCYAAVDIAMAQLARDEYVFLVKVLSLFISFTVLILAALLMMAEYSIILPIDAMATASGNFAFTSEELREESLGHIQQLNIATGDEIENLYLAVTKTMEDSVRYIADSQQKNETIGRMQENLIAILAGMVESRDLYTGNHIKNTADYVRIILNQMRKDGTYGDQLTEEFIANTVRSAPLHDVGKIKISDTLLNKPGRLTPEEFEEMKKHSVYGREIIQSARSASSDETYLDEAENLATYHHERWDGTGYPSGLKGEEIPLSARVMAVADVFDALVSKRSYKEGFTIEKSLDIIREESGTHFDPQVTEAFFRAEEEVRKVAEQKG